MLGKPALLVPSSDEMLEQASLAASEVTQQMLVQKMELEEKKRSVTMLQKALVGHGHAASTPVSQGHLALQIGDIYSPSTSDQ